MSRHKCECGLLLVAGVGPIDSSILVLRDYPDFDDQKSGTHLTGPTAEVLRKEFSKAGMSLNSCYVTSLYPHIYSENCSVDYVDKVGNLLKNKKKVLLMGSGVVEPLFSEKAITLCGVWQKHAAFPGVRFMPCISPGTVLKEDLGELKLALSRFSE